MTAQHETVDRQRNPVFHSRRTDGKGGAISLDCIDGAEIILLTLDMVGRILFINRRGAHLLGRDEGELIGSNWLEKCIQ